MRNLLTLIVSLFLAPPLLADELQLGDVGYQHDVHENHEAYKQLYREVNGQGQQLGDKDYGSAEFLENYKKVYQGGKCACKTGYCRPTDIRYTRLGSPTGYDILVSRQWLPVPLSALQNEKTLSPELMRGLFRSGVIAHVCAYENPASFGGWHIECAIVKTLG